MILPKISFYILLLSVAFAQIPAAPVTSDSESNTSPSDDVDGELLYGVEKGFWSLINNAATGRLKVDVKNNGITDETMTSCTCCSGSSRSIPVS